jgi:glycine dehydrogenase
MVIRKYLEDKGQKSRNVILIPSSAHGTNPASAVMAGMEVVVVNCTSDGNIDIEDMRKKVADYSETLAGAMITYPSTHGVYEETICEITKLIHDAGGQVYMDGANMNAQMCLTSPAKIGADLCHLNLHKTFAIPHGGGGPGLGPIAVADHLVEYLPGHPLVPTGGAKGVTAISSAPFSSAGIIPISYAYIRMSGTEGLKKSAEAAILKANYLAVKLSEKYDILFTNKEGRVAHEFIIDCRPLKIVSGISELDIAKRLMDYGFHAPTLSFPVAGTLMVEPTESESLKELDRFIEAMFSIYEEIQCVINNKCDKEDNVLKNAPHTLNMICVDNWKHSYGREVAAFPVEGLRKFKFWPASGRVNDALGDRNLCCTC